MVDEYIEFYHNMRCLDAHCSGRWRLDYTLSERFYSLRYEDGFEEYVLMCDWLAESVHVKERNDLEMIKVEGLFDNG